MRKPFWRNVGDQHGAALTGFPVQSLACFIVIIFIAFLLRLSTIVWGVAARCVEADQFWFEPYAHAWPVGGVFFLVLFLLFAWNSIIAINRLVRRKTDIILTVVNFIAIIGLFFIAVPAYDTAQIRYDVRENKFGESLIPSRNHLPFLEDLCLLAAPYVGRWNVIQRDLPEYGLEFPALWIEFTQTLEFEAANSRWAEPYKGRWRPPSFGSYIREEDRGVGELRWDRSFSIWVFELDGDILTLTTPNWFDRQEPAVIVLQREATE